MISAFWPKFREFINKRDIGGVFTRTEYKLFANLNDTPHGTADFHRNALVRAGFLKIVGRGRYELVNKIPAGTTTTELKELVIGDRLRYLEKVVARKEREKRIAEEKIRVAQLTETNTRIVGELLSRPCLDCKRSYPRPAMIFSYREAPRRYRALSKLILRETRDFVDELEKCDVVCFNCHLIRETSAPFLKLSGVIFAEHEEIY
jgi:hypothetical protein